MFGGCLVLFCGGFGGPFCVILGFVGGVVMVCLTCCGFCGVGIIQNSDGCGGVGSLGWGGFSGVGWMCGVTVGGLVVGVARVLWRWCLRFGVGLCFPARCLLALVVVLYGFAGGLDVWHECSVNCLWIWFLGWELAPFWVLGC